MFAYLSKKISIPNNVVLNCVGWSRSGDCIACGGESGLLKVIKMETTKVTETSSSKATPSTSSNLSMNQTLEGHNGSVLHLSWNDHHQKLTSSDQNGLIIVWSQQDGVWYEEMINSRNKSRVTGMAWSADGEKICIVYEDGCVIVGSASGNRIWAKDLKMYKFSDVAWSPDGSVLLLAVDDGEVHLYDKQGEFISKMSVACCAVDLGGTSHRTKLCWYSGKYRSSDTSWPTLCIFYGYGKMQFMIDQNDDRPIVVDCGMKLSAGSWSHDGAIIAFAAKTNELASGEKESCSVMFYSAFGVLLRTVRVPGRNLSSLSWDYRSLRLVLVVDSHIYFANVRHDYRRCYFNDTLVISTITSGGTYKCLFWNVHNEVPVSKKIPRVLGMASFRDHCCMLVKDHERHPSRQTGFILYDLSGNMVDSRYTNINLDHLTMNESQVFSASSGRICVFRYRTARAQVSKELVEDAGGQVDHTYHIDELLSNVDKQQTKFKSVTHTADAIQCILSCKSILLVARASGELLQFALPQMTLSSRYSIGCCAKTLSMNSDNSAVASIDNTYVLRFHKLVSDSTYHDQKPAMSERKDVWDIIWAHDAPNMCAIMEKNKLIILRDSGATESLVISGYLCDFRDLIVTSVNIDAWLDIRSTSKTAYMERTEMPALKEMKSLIEKSGLEAAKKYADENSHFGLWTVLGEAALLRANVNVAEFAFVRCQNYAAIQFCKRMQRISSETVVKAEGLAFLGRREECDELCTEANRVDLAVEIHRNVDDWSRVVQLLDSNSIGNDKLLQEALEKLGDLHAESCRLSEAVKCYERAGKTNLSLARCYYFLEQYDKLEQLIDKVIENDAILPELAKLLASVGLCEPAVRAYRKCGMIKEAVQLCMDLNNWSYAQQLSQTSNTQDAKSYIARYAEYLLSKNERAQAIELYRNAEYFIEAAKLILKTVEEEKAKHSTPIRIKKLYVLAALMLQKHKERIVATQADSSGKKTFALLEQGDVYSNDEDAILGSMQLAENPWKGAEAYHFLMLAQRQLYVGDGQAAVRTSLLLRDYEALLDVQKIYSVLALSSCVSGAFFTASKAFIRLESLEADPDQQRVQYADLAVEIFTKHPPKDTHVSRSECSFCDTMIPDWLTVCPSCGARFNSCTVTGRPIMKVSDSWQCLACKHHAFKSEAAKLKVCALCHTLVDT